MKKTLISLLGYMAVITTPVLADDLPKINVTVPDPFLGTKTFTGCWESASKKFCPTKHTKLFNSCKEKGGWYVKTGPNDDIKACLIRSTLIYPEGHVGGDNSVFLLVLPQDQN